MRHNLLTKILVLVLALLVLIPNMGLGVFAADDGPTNEGGSDTTTESSFDVTGSKTASQDVLDENRETTVTLSLPSGEAKYVYDIVFVMDSSSSTTNNDIDFSVQVNELYTELKKRDAILNVGVIKCRGRAFDTVALSSDDAYSGLVEYTPDSAQAIKDGIDFPEKALKDLSSGTNMHGGLKLADKWLTADNDVPADHKFVILLMDGKTYIWNNEEDEPTTVYTQYMSSGTAYGTPAVGQSTGSYSKSAYKHKDNYLYNYSTTSAGIPDSSCVVVSDMTKCFYSPFFEDIYNSTNAELSSTDTDYDFYCAYADKKGTTAKGTPTTHDVTNGNIGSYIIHKKYYEFGPTDDSAGTTGVDWTKLKWLEAAPYEIIDNGDGTYTYDLTKQNPDFYQIHPDSLQKALYLTGHLWTDMTAKYNTAAIIYNGWKGGSGLETSRTFNEWIQDDDVSDYHADISKTADIEDMFNSISEDIIYMVASGVVTDKITDDFILKNPDNVDGFSMTLGGKTVPVSFTDGKWSFGTANDEGVYPYVVEYDKDTKTITWTISVPVENLVPVTLSYDLILEDENADSALYPTNKSAVLDFVTTEGETGTFTFEIPKVAYVKNLDINVRKDWQDANDQDGKRPTKLSVQLLADGEVEESKDLTAESQWTATFSGKPEAAVVRDADGKLTGVKPIVYTVSEGSVDDYTPSTPVGSAEEGFVITNTHTPETIDIKIEKVWYDEDPSLRPASIKVDLLADEEPVESVELSEKTGWKATFEGMPKYSNGEEIVYDVSESGIDVKTYWPLVSPSEDGFTITNTQIFDLKIKKVWDDEDDKDGVRPEEIYVTVLGNGEPFIEEIPIGEYCEWEITLYGMPVFFDGEKVEYSVIEEEVEDYEEPEIIFEPDYGFIITNTHKVEEPPKTDDATNQWFWAGMMVSSMALIAVIFYLKRKQDEE